MDEPMRGGMAPDPAAAPPNDQTQQQPAGANQASPEMQVQYDRFVGRAMEVIYNPAMFSKVVNLLRGTGAAGGKDGKPNKGGPAQGLANATVMVIRRVHDAAKQAGEQLPPDVIFHGGSEIFSQLAEISDKAGLSDYANDRDALEAAYFKAIDMYLQQASKAGEIDQQAAQAQMQKLQQMDQNGQLTQVLRDLDAKDQAGREPPANDNEAPPSPPEEQDEELAGGMAPRER